MYVSNIFIHTHVYDTIEQKIRGKEPVEKTIPQLFV